MRIVAGVALLLTLTGCPRNGHDGGRATVHVVTQTGIPAVGALVFVHDHNGKLIATGETEDGDATVVVDGREMITAFYAFTTDIGLDLVSVYTIADVQPGDELYFPVESFDTTGADRGEVVVTLSGTTMGGADGYGYALAGCPIANGSTMDPAGSDTLVVPASCPGDTFEPWAFARSQGLVTAFQLLPSRTLADLDANGVSFPGPWRTDFDEVAYSLTNLPTNAYSFTLSHRQHDANARRLSSDGAAALLLGVTSTSGQLVTVPFATTDFALVETAANSTAGVISLVRAAPPADVVLDFATMPGYLGSATVAAISTGAGNRLEISWTGAPAARDVVELSANYGVGKNRNAGWRFRLPPDTVSPFRFPEWPSDIDGDAPPETADLVDLGDVRFTDGEWPGWAEARQDDPRDDLSTADRRIVERLLD
jgi:hypothetical protein